MQLADKKYDFATMDQKDISLEVANFSNQDLKNVEIDITITSNHGVVEHIQRQYNLPAHHSQPFVVKFMIRKQGDYRFTFKVDPNNKQPDTDRSDNILFEDYNVDFDLHYQNNHHWADAKKFNIYIDNAIIKNGFTQEDVINCFRAWNGISSKVAFSANDFHFVSQDDFPAGSMNNIYVKLTTTPYMKDENLRTVSSGTQNPGNSHYVGYDDGRLLYSWINLNDDSFYTQSESATGQSKKTLELKTLTHEVGHVLGLAHPCTDALRPEETGCGDKAIMWETINLDYVEYSIQLHDEWNLIQRYKNIK